SHVYVVDASFDVTITASDGQGGSDAEAFRVDVLLAGVTVKSRQEFIGPGQQLSVGAAMTEDLGTESVVGTLIRDPNGSGQATLIVAVVPREVDLTLDASLRASDRLITAFDVRAVRVSERD